MASVMRPSLRLSRARHTSMAITRGLPAHCSRWAPVRPRNHSTPRRKSSMAAVCVPVYHLNTTSLPKFLLLKILWTQLDLVPLSSRVVAAVVGLVAEVPPNPPPSRPHSPRTPPSPSRSSPGWKNHVRTPSKKTAPPAQAQLMVCVPTVPYPLPITLFPTPPAPARLGQMLTSI